jgi:MFS family permease
MSLPSPVDTASARIFSLVLGGSCLTAMAGTAITPALPGIAAAFPSEDAELMAKFALTAPALFTAISAPVAGMLNDRIGPRPMFIFGALLFALAGGSGMIAQSLWQILWGRAALGVSIAALTTATLVLIGSAYSAERRPDLLGLQGAAMSFGGLLLLVIGGLLAAIDWRLAFSAYLAGILLLPLLLRPLPRSTAPTDVSGGEVAWPPVLAICAVVFYGVSLFYIIPVQLPFDLTARGYTNPVLSGVALASCTFAGGVAGLMFNRTRHQFTPSELLGLAFLLIATGQGFVASGPYWAVLVGMLLAGFGVGTLLPTANSTVVSLATGGQRGLAIGISATMLFLGQFSAPIVVSVLVHSPLGIFATSSALAATAGLLLFLGRHQLSKTWTGDR